VLVVDAVLVVPWMSVEPGYHGGRSASGSGRKSLVEKGRLGRGPRERAFPEVVGQHGLRQVGAGLQGSVPQGGLFPVGAVLQGSCQGRVAGKRQRLPLLDGLQRFG
jgi:hypothetical protein